MLQTAVEKIEIFGIRVDRQSFSPLLECGLFYGPSTREKMPVLLDVATQNVGFFFSDLPGSNSIFFCRYVSFSAAGNGSM